MYVYNTCMYLYTCTCISKIKCEGGRFVCTCTYIQQCIINNIIIINNRESVLKVDSTQYKIGRG